MLRSRSKKLRNKFLLVNFTQLMSIVISVGLILMIPYSKLYHDLRGGIVKLMGLAKLSRFALTFVELHFEDYTFDRLKEIMTTSEEFKADPYILMGAYNGSRPLTSDIQSGALLPHGQHEQPVQL